MLQISDIPIAASRMRQYRASPSAVIRLHACPDRLSNIMKNG
jgi:hypothetical protein